MKSTLTIFLVLVLAASAEVHVWTEYEGVITENLALHFQQSVDFIDWKPTGTVTNVSAGSNGVPVSLVPPMMFFRVVASNEWGVSESGVLTSAPPVAVKVRINRSTP